MNIENVDWQITSNCNRMCPYCFGPSGVADLPISESKHVVDILEKLGAKQIGITGGEPLLYPHIAELIEYIFAKGIRIYLSSNCDLYNEFAPIIKDKVSILGVPLDGPTPTIHDAIRGNGSFQNVIYAIADICRSNCNTKIKVGTVLNKRNKNELRDIEKLLSPYQERILFWKIYELIIYPKNRTTALPTKTRYLVDGNSFGDYINCEKIIIDTVEERNRSYFFLKPNGDVFIPYLNHNESAEVPLGNLLHDDIKLIAYMFQEMVNRSGYNKSFRFMKNPDER